MPCYSAWNELLEPGSPQYVRAEAEVRAKLQTIKHIVDYYYGVNGAEKPDLPAGTVINPLRQPRSSKETAIREAICFHLSCDEVGVSTLYDVCSLLEESSPGDRAYLAVILPCASMLRQHPDRFKTAYS
jgi:hypothetical protein